MNSSQSQTGSSGPGAKAGTDRLLNALTVHPFFQGLALSHLNALADVAMESEFQTGECIFRENDPANRFYLILSGSVILRSGTSGSGAVELQRLGAGEVLGWSWLFPPYQWHFEAVADEPTKAIFFYGTRLREQCDEDPSLGYQLMKRMALVVIDRLQNARMHLVKDRE
jgi:CRP-like cAMP-binding protein